MFGGKLLEHSVVAVEQHDLLVAAFSHQLYLFSLSEATLKDKLSSHRHPLLHLYFHAPTATLYSLDSHGAINSFRIGKHAVLEQLERRRVGRKGLREARVRASKEAEVQVLALGEDGTLTRHVGECEYLVAKQIERILLLNEEYLVVGTENGKTVKVFSAASLEPLFEYHSSSKVTSVQQYQQSLIVGTEQGKIFVLIGFLLGGVVQLTQKLQWHVHAVSSLRVQGSYLYSAGEEGVVVVWHLRENKRDFLPRIGSAITALQVINSSLYCFLTDNSLKAIDLSNDKALLHYKLIINPDSQLISPASQALNNSLLIRASTRGDRLLMRGGCGKMQELDLHSGINTQHSIISRNYVSRLDDQLPAPHQITDICLSKEGHVAVAVQGRGCRSLRFYTEEGGLKLISKVQNCHSGQSSVRLSALGEGRFLSYATDDRRVKVWRLSTRRKESMLDIDEYFWSCEYEINFREQSPRFVSVSAASNRIIITYSREFIVFNSASKTIEGVFGVEQDEDGRKLVGVVAQHHKFIVFFDSAVQLASTFNNSIGSCTRLLSLHSPAITAQSITFNHDHSAFAILLQQDNSTDIYYSTTSGVTHIEAPASESLRLKEIFWLKERLMAIDSNLFFYDLTHERELVQLQRKGSLTEAEGQVEGEEGMEEENGNADYSQLYQKYLQRQTRKDRTAIERSNEVLTVTPSISSAFQMLAPQLFL